MEKYEDLNSCKVKFDKISNMKLKIEQNEMIKNEKNAKQEIQTNNTLKLNENHENNNVKEENKQKAISISFASKNPRGRPQTRVNNNNQIKVCKHEIAHNKLKADQNLKKIESKNTLEYFLSETGGTQASSNTNKLNNNDNMSNIQTETFNFYNDSKINDSVISKDLEMNSDFNIGIFKSNIINQNARIIINNKKRVSLKDLMFYFEKYRSANIHQEILHKIIAKSNS